MRVFKSSAGCVLWGLAGHRRAVPHVPSTSPEMQFQEEADPQSVSTSQARSFPMKAGQFILFNERTLHHSEPNLTAERRLGLAIRVVPPIVRVMQWDTNQKVQTHALVPLPTCFKGRLDDATCASVAQQLGLNRLAAAPSSRPRL